MVEALLSSLEHMLTLGYFGVVLGGVLMGLFLGAVPGLGGLVGFALLLPFVFQQDPHIALPLLIAMTSVTVTGDTIPAVLFGVPGTVGSQATILDGFPMAQKGEAKRAYGAAFTVSMIGGLIGAFILLAIIPIVRPIIFLFSSAELLGVTLLGMSMVSVLGRHSPLVGIALALSGVLFSMVGMDPETGIFRWTFGVPYLLDGFPMIPAILGLFAIPELAALTIKGVPISAVARESEKGLLIGIKDVIQNWFLVIRCSLIGVMVGIVPGMGISVSSWLGYGHAIQSSRDNDSFGKGDVRGVIGPEAANNATTGGALLTTLVFGVPGSVGMIFVLAALTMVGLIPGPGMYGEHLDVTVTIILTLALANIFGCLLCMGLSSQFAKLCRLRINIIAPLIIVGIFLSAIQMTAHIGDVLTLVFFGVMGWILKRVDWPRPPMALGMVLAPILGRYLFISNQVYGAAWLLRPGVIIMGIIAIASSLLSLRKRKRTGDSDG